LESLLAAEWRPEDQKDLRHDEGALLLTGRPNAQGVFEISAYYSSIQEMDEVLISPQRVATCDVMSWSLRESEGEWKVDETARLTYWNGICSFRNGNLKHHVTCTVFVMQHNLAHAILIFYGRYIPARAASSSFMVPQANQDTECLGQAISRWFCWQSPRKRMK